MPRLRSKTPPIEKAIRQLVAARTWDIKQPLPSTRALSRRHKVSSPSVCRLMQRLCREGVIWQRDNGRYYPKESRRIFERHKPYACLIRDLPHWGRAYHAIMSGLSHAFADRKASLLLLPNETLVRPISAKRPSGHVTLAAQREALADFRRDHKNQVAGIVFDDAWLDQAIAKVIDRFTNAVVVGRPSSLAGVSTVSVDFDSVAIMAISHLRARGHEEIWIAAPGGNSAPIDLLLATMLKKASDLGSPINAKHVWRMASADDRELLIVRLKWAKRRIGLFCLEDNLALALWRLFPQARIDCPGHVGLLSGLGDVSSDQGISIKIDYESMGRVAGEILTAGERCIIKQPGRLAIGQTT